MMSEIYTSLAGLVCFSPLIGALIAGFFAKRIGAFGAQFMTIYVWQLHLPVRLCFLIICILKKLGFLITAYIHG